MVMMIDAAAFDDDDDDDDNSWFWGDLQEPSLWNSGRNFYTSQWKCINHPV